MTKTSHTQLEELRKEFELLWGEAPKGSLKEKKGAELLKLFETHLQQVEREAYSRILTDLLIPSEGGIVPTYLLDNPDGGLKKAYEELLEPRNYVSEVKEALQEEEIAKATKYTMTKYQKTLKGLEEQ